MVLAAVMLAAAATAAAAASPASLRCDDESAQLFAVDVELLDASGSVIFSSESCAGGTCDGAAKVCYSYPIGTNFGSKFETAWQTFTDLRTVQFVVPSELASRSAATVRLLGQPASGGFASYYQDQWGQSSGGSANHSLAGGQAGDPIHLSIFEVGTPDLSTGGQPEPQGDRLMAVWISYAQPELAYDCSRFDHCCNITDDIAEGLSEGTCAIGRTEWQCLATAGSPWAEGQPVGAVNYLGALANSPEMAHGQKSLLVHLSPTADLSVPLTNSYAEHKVHDSPACRALCSSLTQAGGNSSRQDLFKNKNAAACKLAQQPSIKARAGYGRITVNGFGRVNGRKMMEGFSFEKTTSVWTNPGLGALNGYGNVAGTFATIADSEAANRWRIMSGLVELSSAGPNAAAADKAHPVAADPFAIDVSEIAVGWSPKRGDGAIRLQFPRVPLDNGRSSNLPVKLHDVKTPGTWVGASDGEHFLSPRLSLQYSPEFSSD
jgi:hypothetical protein